MTANISVSKFTAVVEHTTELQYIDIGDGAVAYRITKSTKSDKSKMFAKYVESSSSFDGLGTLKSALRMATGKTDDIEKIPGEGAWYLATDRTLEYFGNYDLRFEDANREKEMMDQLSNSPFELASTMPLDELKLVRIDYDLMSVYDAKGVLLPCVFVYNYMSGAMHNKRYDLAAVLFTLQSDKRVKFVNHKRSYYGAPDPVCIQTIPYYNNNESHTHHLSFYFSPTADDAKRIGEWLNSNKKNRAMSPRHEAVAVLDLLNIQQFELKPSNDD